MRSCIGISGTIQKYLGSPASEKLRLPTYKQIFAFVLYMNISTTTRLAIATTSEISQVEFDSYIEEQADAIAPDFNPPIDPIAARLRLNNRLRVQDALTDGELFWQKRQDFKLLKDFKVWLIEQGFTWKNVCKYIKLYETFASFELTQIAWVDLSTLFQLCQPRYKELLEKLRSLSVWTDARVSELMQEWREVTKKTKAKTTPGLINLPTGGRAFQFPLLHDDKTIADILKLLNERCVTPIALLKNAIASYCLKASFRYG